LRFVIFLRRVTNRQASEHRPTKRSIAVNTLRYVDESMHFLVHVVVLTYYKVSGGLALQANSQRWAWVHFTSPNPTQAMMLSQGSNSTHPPLHNNPPKGDIFQLNAPNSKIQNRSRSYIGYNMPPTNSYNAVQSHNHSHNSPARSHNGPFLWPRP